MMRVLQFFFLFVSFLCKFDASNVADNAEDMRACVIEPFYPRENGIVNQDHFCYMNSLFSCLYSIPMIQSQVYEIAAKELPQINPGNNPENDTLTIGLARVFAKMRLNSQLVYLEDEMYSTLEKHMGWSIEYDANVIEFWREFISYMSESAANEFKRLFEVKMRLSFIRDEEEDDDDGREESRTETHNFLSLDISEEGPSDIMSLLKDQHLSKIENTPDVLIMHLQRIDFHSQDEDEVLFSYEYIDPNDLIINGSKYIPMAFILYDAEIEHYCAVTKDYESGRYFLHNDETVVDVTGLNKLTNDLAIGTEMVFYAKETSLRSKIEEIRETVKSNRDIPLPLLSTVRGTRLKRPLGLRATMNMRRRRRIDK